MASTTGGPAVGVDGGGAVAGEVLAHGGDPAGGQAAHEGHGGPAGGRRVGPEGAVADDAVPAGPGSVQDRSQVGGDAEGGQVAASGEAIALDPFGGHAAELAGGRRGADDPGQAGHPGARLLVDGHLQRDLGPVLQGLDQRPDLGAGDDVGAEQQHPAHPLVDQPPADRPGRGAGEADQQELGELDAEGREGGAGGLPRGCGRRRARLPALGYRPPPGGLASGGRGPARPVRLRARRFARLLARLLASLVARLLAPRTAPVAGGDQEDQHQPGRQGTAPGQASTSWPSSAQRVWNVPGRSMRW